LIQTRWFTRAGLPKQDAIEIICRKNAQILGVDKILGTFGAIIGFNSGCFKRGIF
jgi:imidazolonepropionase-like amidohydrolase